ncbi:alpha/beta hydrolase [Williamsia sp. Leaf354]|uniref:alpha/beta fold hydrolase n=1 Tax=Williamsia sp. Leaf354 TaxID=1736349 RepID=UPI0006FC4A17|nr:alpha/beta fold hydrolase [Williamsia sp. Leaf354]KQR98554.1 alpha/beta hydrolase [Williamsia sp. Leaf354]
MTTLSTVTINGEPAAYRDVGRGEVILLIHGMAGSSATWRDVIPELARHHRVLAPDLPGHGASGKPRGDYSLGSFAAWLRDLLDELDIDRVTVVGQSLGGGVAMQFSYQHPEYCQRLALISSGGLGPDVSWTLRLLAAPGAELLMPVIAAAPVITAGNKVASWLGDRGLRAPRANEMWRAHRSLGDRETRAAFLRTLRAVVDHRGQAVSAMGKLHLNEGMPTLLIWGDDDAVIPVAHAHAAHEAMPASRLEILPGVGHFPQVEDPDAVARLLLEFQRQPARTRRPVAPGHRSG